ncbi:site-specific integrase [Cryobacterium sp. Hh11]|uniref:tyrosine-type recombinase/integrase n=1 Tax=Cryobacterium sp. Hh11 TaxID=2555868 RepID=UPI00106CDC43|nr:site-specific integrase [Cryobacterium sp. Hh11]TFD47614.1 site-specific integrase [Cryobacterium sp. Hh11]
MRAAKGEGSVPKKTDRGWRGYVTVGGKRKYTKFHATKAACAQEKRELLTRRDDGKLVAGTAPTVTQWVDHWLENIAGPRATTYAMNRWVLDKKITPELGSIRISALTVERLEQWVKWLKVAPTSQRRYLAPLKAALAVAETRGMIGFNPALRVELGPVGKADTTSFSREDRDAILDAATGRNAARWHLALRMGIRPSECLGLAWPDYDARTGRLTIRNQLLRATGVKGLFLQPAAKTAAGEREIRLPRSLITMLDAHRAEQLQLMADMGEDWIGFESGGKPVALMFPQENGKGVGATQDTRLWRALLTSAGLGTVKRYQSRHTSATHMLVESGGDVAVVAKILGHKDSAFTYRTYVHPLDEREDALVDQMDAPRAPYRAPYGANSSEHQRTPEGADR